MSADEVPSQSDPVPWAPQTGVSFGTGGGTYGTTMIPLRRMNELRTT